MEDMDKGDTAFMYFVNPFFAYLMCGRGDKGYTFVTVVLLFLSWICWATWTPVAFIIAIAACIVFLPFYGLYFFAWKDGREATKRLKETKRYWTG
jgi:hypothetical protein